MALMFEEIDSQASSIGEISLRRRRLPIFGDRDIYEVKLGDEFLMSSMFTYGEVALADLGIDMIQGDKLQIVVGGLGLGYTAEAALKHGRVDELLVVDFLQPVIDWHRQEKVPLGKILNADARCRYVQGDFFALAASAEGFDPSRAGRQFDAILLDIDHSPKALLSDSNSPFYSSEGLARLAAHLRPGGVFAYWSTELPEADFLALLGSVFVDCRAEVVEFFNPFQNQLASNTVYLARKI